MGSAPALRAVRKPERPLFVNQYSLGLGWDGAPVVVMGTEAAEDPGKPDDLAFHALFSAVVLVEARQDLLQQLTQGAPGWAKVAWDRELRPYHLNPDDFVGVRRTAGTCTWELVAQALSPKSDEWEQLLGGNAGPGLGGLAYQIERSAAPVYKQQQGRPPTGERVQFITDVLMPRLRQTARVLLLHGFGGNLEMAWRPWDQAVIAAFLGLPELEARVEWERPSGTYLGFREHDGRRVVFARALNGAVSKKYIQAVRELVRPAEFDIVDKTRTVSTRS